MAAKLQYAAALFNSVRSLREMFKRITLNLNFKYYCEELKRLGDKPSISFVIPTKNEAKYLPKLLASINCIKFCCAVPAETIVVDYRSVDGTPEIARKMGARVIEVDKPGVGYASYIGVLNAKGDIIIRTDADVIMTPSAIYETMKTFQEKPDKLIATVGHIYYPLELTTNLIAYLYDRYVRKPYNTTGYFIAFKSEVINRVNFNPYLHVHEDFDFGRRAYEVLGLVKIYYNPFIAVLVSSRLIKRKGYFPYVMEKLAIIRTHYITYSQLRNQSV